MTIPSATISGKECGAFVRMLISLSTVAEGPAAMIVTAAATMLPLEITAL